MHEVRFAGGNLERRIEERAQVETGCARRGVGGNVRTGALVKDLEVDLHE